MKPSLLNEWFTDPWAFPIDLPLSETLSSSLLPFRDSNLVPTNDGYILEVAVPGMCKKDLKVEVANNILTIQGQKQGRSKFNWFNKKPNISNPQIYENYVLPEDADVNSIKAKCKNGLLEINISKMKPSNARKMIKVEGVEKPARGFWPHFSSLLRSWFAKVKVKRSQFIF